MVANIPVLEVHGVCLYMLKKWISQSYCYLQWFKFLSWIIVLVFAFAFPPNRGAAAEQIWQKSLTDGNNDLNNQALSMAEACFRRAVKEVQYVPHTAEDKVKCLNAVANVLALENKTKEAECIYQQSLDTLDQAYGSNSPQVLALLFAIGSIYESEGDHVSAMRYYSKAIAINEKKFGPYTPAFADALPRPDQDSADRKYSGKFDQNSRSSLSTLVQQSGLDASKELRKILGDYDTDLLKKNENSDQDLIADFYSQILNAPADSLASSKIFVPSNKKMQSDPTMRSSGF